MRVSSSSLSRVYLVAVLLAAAWAAAAWAAPVAAQQILFVDADATGAADGTSWGDAFVHLQDALAVAEAGDEVWVAEGTYRPTDGGPDPTDRDASFVLPSGVALYGGFDGTESTRDERDWEAHPTVLSGDIGAPGDFSDNAFHVVVASGVDASTVLDGFTVTGGYGNGANPRNRGSGIYGVDASLVVRNVRIVENRVVQTDGFGGGGGAFFEGVGVLRFERVAFERNGGNALGGGLWLLGEGGAGSEAEVIRRHGAHLADADHDVGVSHIDVAERRAVGRRLGSGGLSAVLREVSFVENTGSFGGGAKVDNAPVAMVRTTFERNRAETAGGGLHSSGAGGEFLNVAFYGNVAEFGGSSSGGGVWSVSTMLSFTNTAFVGNAGRRSGAVFQGGGTITLTNATLVSNEAELGGGVRLTVGAHLTGNNSVLWDNVVSEVDASSGSATLSHTLVEGGCPSEVTCEALLDADPLFVRPPNPGHDGAWGTGDDDYGDLRLQENSPAVDFGLTGFLPPDTFDLDGDGDTAEPLPLDLAGEARVRGEGVDLGAYERPGPVSTEGAPPAGDGLTLSAFPNPSRGAVTLRLDTPEAGRVRVAVYDVLGREVAVLHEGPLGAGTHRLVLDGSALPAGLYLVRAAAGGFSETQRVTVVR